ncbi:MAG: NADH-quinone oxidoreductase subunit J [Magnetococcus sp. WYHC-3]
MLADALFHLFAVIIVVAAFLVIISRNPVNSVMFLVLAFFTTAGLFVLLGAEFLAALLIIVYMGAVAILFLFVVMMLDLDFDALKRGALSHLPLGLAVGGLMLLELVAVVVQIHGTNLPVENPMPGAVSNTQAIGQVLFTKYLFPFEVASVVLLVALVGAVVLSLRLRKDVRRQDIARQLARQRHEAMVLVQVKPGEGADKP